MTNVACLFLSSSDLSPIVHGNIPLSCWESSDIPSQLYGVFCNLRHGGTIISFWEYIFLLGHTRALGVFYNLPPTVVTDVRSHNCCYCSVTEEYCWWMLLRRAFHSICNCTTSRLFVLLSCVGVYYRAFGFVCGIVETMGYFLRLAKVIVYPSSLLRSWLPHCDCSCCASTT